MQSYRHVLLFLALASLSLAAACQPAPAPSPTPAPKPAAEPTKPAPPPSPPTVASPAPSPSPIASPAASPSPAAGAATVSGPIDNIAGRVLTIVTATGPRQVQVPESARIEQEGKGVVADLRPGISVGITGRPDATAKSIRIFPAALGTPRPGQFPMAGAEQGNLMTNAVVDSFDGNKLVVSGGGTRFEITVPPDTEILKPLPATFAELATGKRALAAGTAGPDGVLVATSVNIVGPPPQLAP